MSSSPGERPYGGVKADQRRSARRDTLIEAGLDIIGEKGWPGLSLKGLCDADGWRGGVDFQADAAALRARRIIGRDVGQRWGPVRNSSGYGAYQQACRAKSSATRPNGLATIRDTVAGGLTPAVNGEQIHGEAYAPKCSSAER